MQRYLVDVFTAEPGKGNPAAVVLGGADLSGAAMGGLAAEFKLETTFVDGTTLRYYQPSGVAMTLCGHGTLAALAVLRQQGKTGRFTISTPAGDLPVSIEPYLLGMAMPPVTFADPVEPAVAARALGIEPGEIDGPVQVASAGRPKLMVPLRSTAALDALTPDPTAVEEACAATGATGIYPFTLQARSFGAVADARHFPAGAGMLEDPVTGVAAVALAWYLWHHGAAPGCGSIKIEQGHAMGRPGMVAVRQEGDGRTWIYGQAVLQQEG
ncbi:MAG: PhzF family phenazine biosynthesis protein [Bacillota bacterium]